MNEGYFSSYRDNTIDIYHFTTNFHQPFYCDSQRINQYCFKFSDKETIKIDKNNLLYEWDFGDETRIKGLDAEHCFPGTGKYPVKLNIIEKSTGRVFFTKLSYELELKDVEQPFISSSFAGLTGDSLKFDGLMSYLPGYKILGYTWDFGDSERATGDIVKHSYKQNGEYEIKLGLTLRHDSTRVIHESCAIKRIAVFNNSQETTEYINQINKLKSIPNVFDYDHAFIETKYSADQEIGQDAVFQVEILTSKTRLGTENTVFRRIPKKFTLKEIFLPADSLYSYIVDEEMNLMATYPAYAELVASGFKNTIVKPFVLKDPAERELYILKKVYGLSADMFFGTNNYIITTDGYAMLDQIAGLLNKYPGIKIEIATHTDNTGLSNINQEVSQRRAEVIVNYLVNRGINSKRLIAKGFGGSKPIAPNFLEADRRLNRRIDFTIIK